MHRSILAGIVLFTACLLNCISGCNDSSSPNNRVDTPMKAPGKWKEMSRFVAKVDAVSMLSRYAGEVQVVSHDPLWVVELSIDRVLEGYSDKSTEQKIAYAIHSPTKLFAMDSKDAIGKYFEFSVSRLSGSQDICSLTATPTNEKH